MNLLEKINSYNAVVYEIIDYFSKTVPDDHHWGVPDEEHWNGFRDFVKCNEAGVMLEMLCENIKDDLEISIPNDIYNKLVDVRKYFGVSPEYWQDILHE